MKISKKLDISNLQFDEKGYAEITPSLIPNTKMKVYSPNNGETLFTAWFTPKSGYVLHDAAADGRDENENVILRYSVGCCSCGVNYELSTTKKQIVDANGKTVTVTAYGAREFFALPENLIPDAENNIYGK